MKPLKNFKEFLKLGIVKQQEPDKTRAEFLIRETEVSFEGLNERLEGIGVNDRNSNSIVKDCYDILMGLTIFYNRIGISVIDRNSNSIVKDCYDILMGLIRAKMHLDGFKAQGGGAHESEVAYMKVLKLNERDIEFANNVRYFRNGTLYYGTILDKGYAQKVVDFTRRMYPKLKSLFKE